MKVLWLSGNSSSYIKKEVTDVYGGWIGALENEISKCNNIELGIAFIYPKKALNKQAGSKSYYPIYLQSNFFTRLKYAMFPDIYDEDIIKRLEDIVRDFKPDVIHVWGTEVNFGLISGRVNVPVVIHIQGILNAVWNSFFIGKMTKWFYIFHNGRGLNSFAKNYKTLKTWSYNCKREKYIFKLNRYFLGRTTWDESLCSLYSSNAYYYNSGEMLRDPFYNQQWNGLHKGEEMKIVSVLSNVPYKGIDVILKCAKILNMCLGNNFKWILYGLNDLKMFESITGIKSKDVNVFTGGTIDAISLCEELKQCSLFVHATYIDNSPNSISEAQLVGTPVVSTNVGGIGSLIVHEVSGVLVPPNDPDLMAYYIRKILNSKCYANKIGIGGKNAASKRHDKGEVTNNLLRIYDKIIQIDGSKEL